MSPRIIVMAVVILIGFSNLPASSEEKADKGADWTSDELAHACVASEGACFASCKGGSTTFTGQLQQGLCEDNCQRQRLSCLASIPMRKRHKGTTGIPEGGKGTLSK